MSALPVPPSPPGGCDQCAERYAEGFRDGVAAGAAQRVPGELLTTVELAWRRIRAGDVLCGEDGAQYAVVWSGMLPGGPAQRGPASGDGPSGSWGLELQCGAERLPYVGDPDVDVAAVQVPVELADALLLTRAELGAVVLASRTDPDGGRSGDLPWRDQAARLRGLVCASAFEAARDG